MRTHYTLLFLLLVGHFHLEDGKTLVPIEFDIHNKWKHTGSTSLINNKIRGFFEI